MSWTSLRVEPGEHRDEALAALFRAGAMGVHEDGASLVTHFPPEADVDAVRAAVLEAAPDARVDAAPADRTDWSEAWKARLGAHELGRIVIAPPWLAEGRNPASTVVVDPGMAFGTGDHPTTRGVVRLLQRARPEGALVADLGAGSAVLAIAAAKLGAERVAAIEIDPDAIGNAEDNVARNGVADRVHVLEGDAALLLPLVAPVDLVLANIISSALLELLPAIAGALRPDGRTILSGILAEERGAIVRGAEAAGFRVAAEDAEDVWWSVLLSRA